MSTLDTVENNDFVVTFTLDGMGVAEFKHLRKGVTPLPGRISLTHHHPYLQWAALQPSWTPLDPAAEDLACRRLLWDLGFKSESLLTNPKCRTEPNVPLCSQHARPTPTPHIPGWPSAREGLPVVSFAQPSLPTRLTRGRPNSPFPDACPFTLVPPGAQASEAFKGQGWGGVGSG